MYTKMEYIYTGSLQLSDLKGINGKFAEKSEVINNTVVTELVKINDISDSLNKAIIAITNEFDCSVEDNDYEFFENAIKLFKDDEK